MKEGTIALGTLAFIFTLMQLWWISLTMRNGKKSINNTIKYKELKDDHYLLNKQRKTLDNLFKK